ncbi:hypothetical protein AB9F41_38110, partial [Rhizobium leguminosarum]|uniref:hypothetical protein n=1 Tax=Rhizobium leguminosarum TaxID=384 RepID=UPI003F9B0A78
NKIEILFIVFRSFGLRQNKCLLQTEIAFSARMGGGLHFFFPLGRFLLERALRFGELLPESPLGAEIFEFFPTFSEKM